MPRLIACLIALGALLGLLGQGAASAREILTMTSMAQSRMHHEVATSQPMKGCEGCPPMGHDGKPCNDINRCLKHCLVMSGSALVLPDVLPLLSKQLATAQRHLVSRVAALSGLAAPPFTEPPILSA